MTDIDLNSFILQKGGHASFEEGACAMELAAHLAGEPHSDHPKCVCPVIGAFMRSWNDSLPDDKRNELLKPIIPIILNTRSNKATEKRRSFIATDWLVRVYAPAWLRLAKRDTHADALANLPEITSSEQIREVREVIATAWAAAGAAAWTARTAAMGPARDAGDATWAARTAARDAAWAAGDAAGDVAWAAAGDAAMAAAWAAGDAGDAGDAAGATGAIAGATAWAAAWAAGVSVEPTVDSLQKSAVDLIRRMVAVH